MSTPIFDVSSFKDELTGKIDPVSLLAFGKALQQLYVHLSRETEFNPRLRMVDAVTILDGINQVSLNISEMLSEVQEHLKEDKQGTEEWSPTKKLMAAMVLNKPYNFHA